MDLGALPVRLFASLLCIAALAACSPPAQPVETTDIAECDEVEFSGALEEAECQLTAGENVLHVKFAPLASGARLGMITAEVLGEDGGVIQTMLEPDVAEYRAPSVQDIDGDGRADVLIARAAGNVNTSQAIWIYSGERGAYERVGDVNGVAIERTGDGLIVVPARSSATEWDVAFYRLDEDGLHPVATIAVEAPTGRSNEPGCRLTEAPGLRDLNLSEQEARTRFCAEPAAQVFE
jgi:hypothetical protein